MLGLLVDEAEFVQEAVSAAFAVCFPEFELDAGYDKGASSRKSNFAIRGMGIPSSMRSMAFARPCSCAVKHRPELLFSAEDDAMLVTAELFPFKRIIKVSFCPVP